MSSLENVCFLWRWYKLKFPFKLQYRSSDAKRVWCQPHWEAMCPTQWKSAFPSWANNISVNRKYVWKRMKNRYSLLSIELCRVNVMYFCRVYILVVKNRAQIICFYKIWLANPSAAGIANSGKYPSKLVSYWRNLMRRII